MRQLTWDRNPKIGWWMDHNPIRFFHGTHIRNLEQISKNGIKAPQSGSTAGWVSLALDPYTAFGYASMSGSGGETLFRGVKGRPINVPASDRAILVVELQVRWMLQHMNQHMRGNISYTRDRLINKDLYEAWQRTDHEYYATTEIRIGNLVPSRFIIGYMIKG